MNKIIASKDVKFNEEESWEWNENDKKKKSFFLNEQLEEPNDEITSSPLESSASPPSLLRVSIDHTNEHKESPTPRRTN